MRLVLGAPKNKTHLTKNEEKENSVPANKSGPCQRRKIGEILSFPLMNKTNKVVTAKIARYSPISWINSSAMFQAIISTVTAFLGSQTEWLGFVCL